MRIIRPYGRSRVERNTSGELRRFLSRTPDPDKGLIDARAKSISGNVLRRPPARAANAAGWSQDDERVCAVAGDVAVEIKRAAEERERGGDNRHPGRVTPDIAGAALFRHYGCLFPGADGEPPLSIRTAQERAPGLFNLHMAVKDCYARLLKDHRKYLPAHGAGRRKASLLLPEAMDKLFWLVQAKRHNRHLGALVRLGKVIHYEASPTRRSRSPSCASRSKAPPGFVTARSTSRASGLCAVAHRRDACGGRRAALEERRPTLAGRCRRSIGAPARRRSPPNDGDCTPLRLGRLTITSK
ncbi:MAG: hypothetical protein JO223_19760 [Hyphomicrobiales bacterium]|nr:hypothetical protein [Hyphomicrobiales bacterium]